MTDRRPQTETELVEFIRSIDVPAPESLHRRVHSMVAERAGARRRAPLSGWAAPLARSLGAPRLAAAGAIAVAALGLAIALSLSGGSAGLSLREAAALTLRGATQAAPAESPRNREQLAAAVEGVSFPYWEGRLGWRSTGARSDRVGGRRIATVFYADRRGRQIGYAIVAGLPAPRQGGGVTTSRAGVSYRLLRQNGVAVVSWLRRGHLCVVSGRGVDQATLLRLASWDAHGAAAA